MKHFTILLTVLGTFFMIVAIFPFERKAAKEIIVPDGPIVESPVFKEASAKLESEILAESLNTETMVNCETQSQYCIPKQMGATPEEVTYCDTRYKHCTNPKEFRVLLKQ